MPEFADPETLIAAWLHTTTAIKIWADPRLPANERFTAPIAHLQRGAGNGDSPLSIDDVLLDCNVYAATADHARIAQNAIWQAIVFQLPLHTFPNGVFVKSTSAPTRPFWAPDPTLYRRTATYRIILHGLV